MSNFCPFLKTGLVYNNDTSHFTAAPCCYYAGADKISPDKDLDQQLADLRATWQNPSTIQSRCQYCIATEAQGLPSYRQAAQDLVSGKHDAIEMLTVAINKKCNLACVTCGSHSSSFWYQDNLRNGIKENNNIIELHADDRAGEITRRFLSLFDTQDMSHLRYIKFGGGEPLMSSTHKEILRRVPNPGQVTLQYTSNFTTHPTAKTYEMWSQFRLVKWVASLDGIGSQHEFLRWPSSWRVLENAVDRAKKAAPDNVMFGVEHTVNPLNVWYFDRFESWFNHHLATNRAGDASDLNIHPCQGIMGIENTPPDLRRAIEEKYGVDHHMTKLLAQHPYVDNRAVMINYLSRISRQRRQNWISTFPEVAGYING